MGTYNLRGRKTTSKTKTYDLRPKKSVTQTLPSAKGESVSSKGGNSIRREDYKTDEAYASALKRSELASQYHGLSYDQVQSEKSKYAQGTTEYDFFDQYTGYSSLADFDKAISAIPNEVEEDKPFDIRDHITGAVVNESILGRALGYSKPKTYKEQLQTARNQYALDHASEAYKYLEENEDFEEKSQYVSTVNPDDAWWQDTSDRTYEFINDVDGARDSIITAWDKTQTDSTIRSAHPLVQKGLAYMNEDEVRYYNYLYATEGKDKANEFLDAIEVMLTKRATDEQARGISDAVKGDPVSSIALSAVSIPMNVVGAPLSLADSISGNPYGYYSQMSNASSAIRQSVGDNIEEGTDWQIGNTNVARFLYDTGMSIGDSAVGAVSFGHALAPIMGMSAYQQKAKEMTEAGESEDVIFQTALASGLAEAVFEYISIDKLLKIKNVDGLRRGITETLKQMGIEGSEEVATEIANVLSDDLIRGENSELAKMRNELKSRGFSEDEITIELAKYVGEKLALAGIGGALSGGVMGGVASTNNYLGLRSDGESIRESERMTDAFDMASLSPKESEAYEAYSAYAKKGVTADNATDAQLGNLSATLQSDAIKTAKSKKATDDERLGAMIRLADDKLHTPKTAEEKAKEQKRKAEEQAVEQRLETLSISKETVVASTGSATQIKGIKTEDGETVILTSEGEVKASEMTFSQTDAELVAYAEGMSDEKANLFLAQYDGQSKVSDYANSFEMAYAYGETGFGADNVFRHKGVLSEAQAVEIYKAGMTNKAKALQINVDKITAKYDGGEFVKGEFNDSIISYNDTAKEGQVRYKDLSPTQRRMVRFMKAFSKATGVKINLVKAEVVDGKYEGKEGSYNPETNSIDIDIYAGRLKVGDTKNAIATVLSHELTHWMKAKSPALYREMQELAMSNIGSKYNADGYVGYEKARLDEKHGKGHTDEDAIDEIVARTCEDMLANSKTARELLSKLSPKEQKALVGKAKAYIDNVIAWVDELLGAYPAGSEEAKLLRENKEAFEKMSAMWDKALEDAIKANQSLQKAGVTGEEAHAVEQYSIRQIVGASGKNYGIGVYLDGTFLDGLTDSERKELIKAFVIDELAGQSFIAYDKNKNAVGINIVKKTDTIKNKNNKKKQVIRELSHKNIDHSIKQDAIAHIEELIGNAVYVTSLPSKYQHDWLDNYGQNDWDYWTVYIQEKDGSVWQATLDIANTARGDKILYDIDPIKKVEGAIKSASNSTKVKVAQKSSSVKKKNSDREVRTLTDDDYSKLKHHFGTTNNFVVAGYMLANGTMLDFSGKHWGDTTSRIRQVDHRDVSEVIPDSNNGYDSMVRMISNGNIRLMPENGGINLAVAPTKNQRTLLRRYIDYMNQYQREGIVLDIDAVGGDTIKSFTYEAGTSADRILADIDRHFKGGNQSELMRFHTQYSDRDSKGNLLTEAQQRFFANSQVRDENGNLLVVYHGTRKADFSVFKRNQIYFTDSKEMADSYSPNGEGFEGYLNITKPLVIDAQGERWSRIPIDAETKAFLEKVGASVFKEGGKWRTTPADIAYAVEDGIEEGEFDYDGIIIKNVDDTGSYRNAEDNVVATDYIAFNSNQFKRKDNTNPTEDMDIRYSDRDYGYHAGDLGKAEGYWNMVSANRGTGHFGTGTYFVGDEAQLTGNYAERPHEKVDFSKYNLFRPYYEDEGFKLHDALKRINNMMHLYPISNMTFDERYGIKKGMDNAGYVLWNEDSTDAEVEEAIAYLEDIRQKYGWYIRNRLRWSDVVEKEASEMTRDDYEYFADQGEEVYNFLNDVERDFHGLSFEMQMMLSRGIGFSEAEARHKQIMQEIYDEVSRIEDAYNARYEDSPSTRYMKKWGYEGVDVRHLKALDNTKYGSVIYDLKGEDLARKQEIGTARYSDRDDVSLYETIGEDGRLAEENAKLAEDIAKLASAISGDAVSIKRFRSLADYLKKLAGSNVSREMLGDELKELYEYIQSTPDIQWNNVMAKSYDIARDIMNVFPDVTPNYFKSVMADIRKDKVTLSPNQNSEAVKIFGSYGDFHKRMFGRVNIVNEGTPLTEMWKKWSQKYPTVFDANLTETEQIKALVDILDALKTTSSLMSEYEREEAIRHLATEVYNQFWNIASDASEDVKKLRADHRKLMEDLRKAYDARQKESTLHPAGEVALKYEQLLRKVKESDAKEMAKIKELGKKRMTDYKDKTARNAKIAKIKKTAKTLEEYLLKNSKDKHISEDLKPMVRSLVQAIDYGTSTREVKKFVDAGLNLSPTEMEASLINQSAENMARMKAEQKLLDALYKVQKSLDSVEFFGLGIEGEIDKLVNDLEALKENSQYPLMVLNAMSLEQLETIDKLVSAVKSVVLNANKLHTKKRNLGVDGLGRQITGFLDGLGVGKVYKDAIGKYAKVFKWLNVVPHYAFNRLGDGGKTLFGLLQDGWDKLAFNVKQIFDFVDETYTKEDVKKWSKEVKEFTVGSTKFKMTIPQIMSLQCLYKREQGRKHILGNGIRIGNFENGIEVVNQPQNIKVTAEDVESILSVLSPEQKAVAEKIQGFMNTVCTEWGNYVSMERFGYKAFGEDNYFPIEVDENNVSKDKIRDNKNVSLYALLNMGFTKSINENSKNALVVNDIFDVFANHASEMAKYNALGLAVLDFNRVMNYSEVRGDSPYSIRTAMEIAYGKDAEMYFNKLIADLNGTQNVSRDMIGKGFMAKAKLGAIGWNIKTVLLQPTAYLKASALIDKKYLVSSVVTEPHLVKRGIERAKKYCGIALWKSLGFYDTNISRGVVEQIKHEGGWMDSMAEKSTKWMEKADELTFGALWNACELEVKNTHKDLKVGSEEFYQTVAERLREVIYATQVVDSTLTRSEMMRSGDSMDKMLTAFGSEPILAYNMLLDTVVQTDILKRSGASKEELQKNRRKVAKVLDAYIATNLVTAMLEAFVASFRDEDEPDEEEIIKMIMGNFASNMSIIGKIPFLKDIISIFSGYSPSRLDMQGVQSLYYAWNSVKKNLQGEGSVATTLKHSLKAWSSLSGLGFFNAYRDAMALLNKLEILTPEELEEMLNDLF